MASTTTPAETTTPAAPPATEVTATGKEDDTPKITLYWLEQSRSQRILWLLEELSLPYTLEIFHRDPKTHLAGPELKAIHPLGKSPALKIQATGPEKNEVLLAESGLITEYLVEHFGTGTTLAPVKWRSAATEGKVGGEAEGWLRYRYYMHYAEGSLMILGLVKLIAASIAKAPVPFFIRPITSRIAGQIESSFVKPNMLNHFAFLEEQLKTAPGGSGGYLCGPNLTAADILISFPLIAMKERVDFLTKVSYPTLVAYIEKLEAQKGYKKAVQKIIDMEGHFSATL